MYPLYSRLHDWPGYTLGTVRIENAGLRHGRQFRIGFGGLPSPSSCLFSYTLTTTSFLYYSMCLQLHFTIAPSLKPWLYRFRQ